MAQAVAWYGHAAAGRTRNTEGKSPDGGGLGGGDGSGRNAVTGIDYKTKKRPADNSSMMVYTISGSDVNLHGVSSCGCCQPPVGCAEPLRSGHLRQQRHRPRTWTCGAAGTVGGTSLTRSRTFTSNYERAISSLLWQPYECRSSSNSLNDDGDVAVWLNSSGRYEPLSSRSSLSLSTIPRYAPVTAFPFIVNLSNIYIYR